MKRTFLLLIILLISFSVDSQTVLLKNNRTKLSVTNKSLNNLRLSFSVGELNLNTVKTNLGTFFHITNPSMSRSFGEGTPELPQYSKLIEIPYGAKVTVKIISYKSKDYKLSDYGLKDIKLLPSYGSIRKDGNPDTIKIKINKKIYNTNNFFGKDKIVQVTDLGQMRDFHLGKITIQPFAYNPVTNTLRVYTDIKFNVEFEGSNTTKSDLLKTKYASPITNSLNNLVLNPQGETKDVVSSLPMTYVIIAPPEFKDALQPFIEWKEQKGFKVIATYTDGTTINADISSIRSYLSDLYNNPPAGYNPPSYLLIVGDIEQIPAHQYTEINDSPYSDLYYADYTNDYMPEVDFGRWSAEDAQTVADIVAKTIRYEKLQMADISYLKNTFGVAGDDESHEDTYGGGAIWYANNYYLAPDPNISNHRWLQKDIETWSGGNSQAHDSIIYWINKGVSFANYTAHCSPDGWYSPSFTRSDLNNIINNDDKFGVWIGNCCQSNKFDEDEAFGEIAIRKANAGVVDYIGGSQYTYWDEDYYWGVGVGNIVEEPSYTQTTEGTYDATFHNKTNEENTPSKWATSAYDIIKYGNLAVTESNSNLTNYYWVIYQVAGDPSVEPYIGLPKDMTVNMSPSTLLVGSSSINISTNAPYATVAVTQNNSLIGIGRTDSDGNAEISFTSPVTSDIVTFVITKQFYKPVIINQTPVAPAGPYLSIKSFVKNVEYNSTNKLMISIENIGDQTSDSTIATITTSDPYVTISNPTHNYGILEPEQTASSDTDFVLNISANIPNQHIIPVHLQIKNNLGQEFNYDIDISSLAPAISIKSLNIANDDNSNGYIDPGETADIQFLIENSGSDTAVFSASLSTSDALLTLNTTDVQNITLYPGSTEIFNFSNASADASTEAGTPVSLNLKVEAGISSDNQPYTSSKDFQIFIGEPPTFTINQGGTNNSCTGFFYDSGNNTANYANNENYIISFAPTDKDFIKITFNNFNIENGYDKLYVYNGIVPDTSLIGVYTGTTIPEHFSSDKGLTFKFTSDGSVTSNGWEAQISCYNVINPPQCPQNPIPEDNFSNIAPNQLKWDAQDSASFYIVYFGTDSDPTTNSPDTVYTNSYKLPSLSNSTTYYWTVEAVNKNGRSGSCNVWSFTTPSNTITMQNGSTTTCGAAFTDTGGPDANYSNSENYTYTFLAPDTTKRMAIYFSDFQTESGYDYLEIFDGPDASYPSLGKFDGINEAEVLNQLQPIVGKNTGDLTVKFYSDGSTTAAGWIASVYCIQTYKATISVVDDANQAISNATISFNNEQKSTDKNGITEFIEEKGDYTINITKEGYFPVDTNISLDRDTSLKITLEKMPVVTFIVKDENGNPISSAEIDIDANQYFTDLNGIVSVPSSDGDYKATINANCYYPIDTAYTVAATDLSLNISLKKEPQITFNVTNGTEPIENIQILINDISLSTNSDGQAQICLPAGRHFIVFYSPCYQSVSMSIDLSADKTINVDMTKRMFKLSTLVTYNGRPVENAKVQIDTMLDSTDASGYAYFSLPCGNYTMSVSSDFYAPKDVNFSISGANLNLEINLDDKTALQTFNDYKIKIYPNPVKDMVYISADDDYDIILTNSTGQILQQTTTVNNKTKLNMSDLAKGIYFVKLKNDKKVKTLKILKE